MYKIYTADAFGKIGFVSSYDHLDDAREVVAHHTVMSNKRWFKTNSNVWYTPDGEAIYIDSPGVFS